MHVPDVLPALLGAGLLGRKAGKGFYKYRKGSDASLNKQVVKLRPPRMPNPPDRNEIETRLVLLMVNEAARCLQDGIIKSPRDGDVGAVFGIGFPPFRGGPFRYMDTLGIQIVVQRLEDLNARFPGRFEPADLLLEMARRKQSFYSDERS